MSHRQQYKTRACFLFVTSEIRPQSRQIKAGQVTGTKGHDCALFSGPFEALKPFFCQTVSPTVHHHKIPSQTFSLAFHYMNPPV